MITMTEKDFGSALATAGERAPFAERMRELREEKGFLQRECAEALGVATSVYTEMEGNTVAFRRRDLVTLAALYRMPLHRAFPGLG